MGRSRDGAPGRAAGFCRKAADCLRQRLTVARRDDEADALIHIRAADMRHFEQVVERVAAEPFVQRTRSAIVLSRLVDTVAPVPLT